LLAASTETWWTVGWIVGGAVVLVAAVLLLAIIALARRIVRQAGEISSALAATHTNAEPLFDLANVNYSLEQISRRLHDAASPGEAEGADNPGRAGGLGRRMRTFLEGGESP
jgi:hypothetical protein